MSKDKDEAPLSTEEMQKAAIKAGLLLERRAAAILREVGFSTIHSYWYQDPNGEKAIRESDVLGCWPHPKLASPFRFYIAIECKQIGQQWVLGVDPCGKGFEGAFSRALITKWGIETIISANEHPYGAATQLARQGFVARREKPNDSEIYSACDQAVKAARHRFGEESRGHTEVFVSPMVLVPDDRLFAASFDLDKGDVTVQATSHELYLDRRQIGDGLETTLVDLITPTALRARAAALLSWARAFAAHEHGDEIPSDHPRVYWERVNEDGDPFGDKVEAVSREAALKDLRTALAMPEAAIGYSIAPRSAVFRDQAAARSASAAMLREPRAFTSPLQDAIAQILVYEAPIDDEI